MATNYNLKFYKGGNQPTEAGSIWFKDGLLSVIGVDLQPEYFSGVRDANFAENVLTIVKANGDEVKLDFSDVASKDNVDSLLGSLRDSINELSATVDANKTAAETGIQEAKDAAQDAADAAGAVADDLAEYVEANDAAVDVIRKDLADYETENNDRVKAVEDRATALEGKVDGEDGLVKKVESLEKLFTGTEGGVQDIVTGEIAKLGGEATGEGTYVDVKVTTAGGQVTGVVVTEDFTAITDAITAEAERADAAEKANADAIAAEKARIDILVGAKDEEGNFVDAGKSVRTIANEELAAQLIGENADEALDTLKEIADWIQQHPEDAAAMNTAIEKNATDITNITKENGTIDTKVAAAEGRVDEKLKDYAKTSEVEGALEAYSTTEEMNAAIKVVGDKADANATAIENITKEGGAIANAVSAAEGRVAETYATKQALTDGLAGKVDNDAFTTYQGTVTEALAGKATVAAVEKNAEDIEALQTQVNNGLIWAHFA